MIFAPNMAKLIMAGRKTQDWRPVKGKHCPYNAGHSYALQIHGKPAEKRITVIEKPREDTLAALSLRDARRSGFRTTEDFRRYWTEVHGRFDPEQRCWVISFILGDHTDADRFPAARFGAHGDYVPNGARALNGTGAEVSAGFQTKLATIAAERRDEQLADRRQRLQRALAEIRQHATGDANARLRDAQRRIGLTSALDSLY